MDDVNATVGDAVRERAQWVVPGLAGSLFYIWWLKPKTPLEGLCTFVGGAAATIFIGPFVRDYFPSESKNAVPFLGFLLGSSVMLLTGIVYRWVDNKGEGILTELSDAWTERLKPPGMGGGKTAPSEGEIPEEGAEEEGGGEVAAAVDTADGEPETVEEGGGNA